jgi:hypothetical protein
MPFFYAAQHIIRFPVSPIWHGFLSSEAAIVMAAATFAITFRLAMFVDVGKPVMPSFSRVRQST